MSTITVLSAIAFLWLTVVLLSLAFWKRINDIETRMRDALQNLQIQLAFVAGRIGLNKKDLDRVKETPDETQSSTEVLGRLDDWNDFDEELQEEPAESEKGRG